MYREERRSFEARPLDSVTFKLRVKELEPDRDLQKHGVAMEEENQRREGSERSGVKCLPIRAEVK